MVLDEHKESSERSLEEVKKDINQLKEELRALKMWSEQSLEEVKINNERRGLSIGEIWENMGEFSKDLETLKVSSEQSLEAVKKDTTQLQGGLEEIANDQLQERPIFEDPDEHEMSSEQLQPDCEEERPSPVSGRNRIRTLTVCTLVCTLDVRLHQHDTNQVCGDKKNCHNTRDHLCRTKGCLNAVNDRGLDTTRALHRHEQMFHKIVH